MTNKTFITYMWVVVGIIVVFSYSLRAVQNADELQRIAKEVCRSAGFENYRKLDRKKSGTYTVTCYNKQWKKLEFEL